jgi:hypothetical protein
MRLRVLRPSLWAVLLILVAGGTFYAMVISQKDTDPVVRSSTAVTATQSGRVHQQVMLDTPSIAYQAYASGTTDHPALVSCDSFHRQFRMDASTRYRFWRRYPDGVTVSRSCVLHTLTPPCSLYHGADGGANTDAIDRRYPDFWVAPENCRRN